MKLQDIRVLRGPNIHCGTMVVEALIDISPHASTRSDQLAGLADSLLAVLPGLQEHQCSLGRPGGFIERLREGTLIGHIIEHVALELQAAAGMNVVYGKTRSTRQPGLFRVVFECWLPEAGLCASRAAVDLVASIMKGQAASADETVEELKRLWREGGIGPSTQAIIDAARRRRIPVIRAAGSSLVQLGYGARRRMVRATTTDVTSCLAADIAGDKTLTKEILYRAGIPVPPGGVATTVDRALALAAEIGYPVVVKPLDGNQGKGVALNLTKPAEVRAAFKLATIYSPRVIVERHISGRHYRVLVVKDRVVAAAERLPARVVGDGHRSIAELVDEVNRDPRRGVEHEKPLTQIKIDAAVQLVLAKQGKQLTDIPATGEVVYLRENANLSTGGTARDATDELHPDNRELCLIVARTIGLDICGIDLVAEDLSVPIDYRSGAIIEVNAAPGIRMHHYPVEGESRDVGAAIVDSLFGPNETGRIPIVAVTGTNGKTTTARMIATALKVRRLTVGLASTDGIYMGSRCLFTGDTTGPWSAETILTDCRTEVAVLETARGGILRAGLGYDWANVAVVTNISGDHLGQDGVEDLEDLVYVKSLVVERVWRNGHVVLNADDPHVFGMSRYARGRIIYFSTEPDNLNVRKHIAKGGQAVYLRGNCIWLAQGHDEKAVLYLADVPATLDGRAQHNVENCLAAVGALAGLGLTHEEIRNGLRGFAGDLATNQGRFNLHQLGGVQVIVDYGHNPAALEAALQTARGITEGRLIGVIAAPGDRRDETLLDVGAVAGRYCQRVVVKEDADLRGRRPGEVAQILAEGVRRGGLPAGFTETVLDEAEATRRGLSLAQPGDTVIIFYEKLDKVLAVLRETEELAAPVGSTLPTVVAATHI